MATSDNRNLRVLIVDDDRNTADNLARVIRLWGHVAHAVYGGQEALDVAWTLQPDVVLIDFGMPHVDGGEVATELPLRSGGCPMLLAVTGFNPDWVTNLYPEAFDRCLRKPLEMTQLQAILAAARKLDAA
jgi:CheY-like chemotaxis protein